MTAEASPWPRLRGIMLAGLVLALPAAAAQAACPPRVGVGHGDTLASIARACGISVETLRDANPGINAGRLRPGLVLAIPRPALPSPQLPLGRPSLRVAPSLMPPASTVGPPAITLPEFEPALPPAATHPQMPREFDVRPPHMQPPRQPPRQPAPRFP